MIPRLLERPAAGRAVQALYWLVPVAVLFTVYRLSMRSWFQQDDFAWLGLNLTIHDRSDVWRVLTQPMAQGTLRILSERLLFMSLTKLFGLEIVPFKVVVFGTAAGIVWLMGAITTRLSGSRLAGCLAGVLWGANAMIATALSWTSAYNQLMCGFFMLAALYCRLRGWRAREWIAFLLGFGALELNVVYPAIAAVYTWSQRRSLRETLWRTWPLFLVSGLYTLVHRSMAPPVTAPIYRLYIDWHIPETFWTYWKWVLGAGRYQQTHPIPDAAVLGATLALTAGLVGFAVWEAWRGRRWGVLVWAAWFLAGLGPLLPLREHISDYYLTMPSIGLAAWGGWAVAAGLLSKWMKKGLALGLVLLYLLPSVAAARISSRWWYERGRQVRALVLGVDRAHQLHPGKPILLTGIEDALFWSGVYDRPFRLLLGPPEVYLAPGAESSIREKPEGGLGDYSLPAVIAKRLLEHDEAVVYEAGGERLRNVTSRYRDHISPAWPEDAPRYVNIGSRWYGSLLGPGWHADEGGYRWMGSRAEVTVGAPPSAGMSVYVTGYATPENLVNGGQPFVVKVESRTVLETRVEKAGRFDVSGPLPPGLEKLTQLRVEFSTSRTFRPPQESRDLGLAFGEVAVR